MKKLLLILLTSLLFADNTILIKNLIGEKKFTTYYELLKPILNETSLQKTLKYLQSNGLLDIFFDKPRLIHPKFVFLDNNPVFNSKTLYDTLNSLGYYYFYPVKIKKNSVYSITLELKSTHFIDPLIFINTIKEKGCNIVSIEKKENYKYTLDCKNEKINAKKIISKKTKLIDAKGVYWLNTNNFQKAIIVTSKYDKWYPYIVFYDKNLNILNIIAKENKQQAILIDIPFECKYLKISDTYSKQNFKRGITVKGLQ